MTNKGKPINTGAPRIRSGRRRDDTKIDIDRFSWLLLQAAGAIDDVTMIYSCLLNRRAREKAEAKSRNRPRQVFPFTKLTTSIDRSIDSVVIVIVVVANDCRAIFGGANVQPAALSCNL